jgi:hypothetical protein
MAYQKRKPVKNLKKIYFSVAGIVLVVLLGTFLLVRSHHHPAATSSPTTKTLADGSTVNLAPPTDEDKQAVDQHKDDLGNQQNTPPTPSGQNVTPVITVSGQSSDGGPVEVRGFIPGIFEDGGTCTANFTLNAASVVKTSNAVKDATVTRCTNFSIARSEFSPGTWTLTLEYTSAAHQGSSETTKVEVN